MPDLIDFIAARLDEDEAVARSAMHVTLNEHDTDAWSRAGKRAHVFDNGARDDYEAVFVQTSSGVWDRILVKRDIDGKVADHIVRHDPARVLRDVHARRSLLDFSTPTILLRALVQPYADHPDFGPEWAA